MRAIPYLVRKEFLQVFRDRTTVFQIFLIPVVQLLVLSNAATFELQDTRLVVIDEDRTPVSSGLVNRLTAGGEFVVTVVTGDPQRAEVALLTREATGVLRIPTGFAADLRTNGTAPVQLQLNAEEGAVAGVVQASAMAIVASYTRSLGLAGPAVSAPPLTISQRAWFNPSRNYKHWMVPALLVSLTTIIGLLLTAQNITREKELGTLDQLNVTPITRGEFIAAKLIPFWLMAMVVFSLGMIVAKLVFRIPTVGSVPLVFLSAAVYLVVALGLGLWISTFTHTQQQAMFVAFFVVLIFLLMSGLFTPVEAMPDWAQIAAEFNPVKHFVGIMRAVLVRGAGIDIVWRPLAGLAVGGAVVLTLAVSQYHKSTA
jgi:ABC-2 type transport system permease protein